MQKHQNIIIIWRSEWDSNSWYNRAAVALATLREETAFSCIPLLLPEELTPERCNNFNGLTACQRVESPLV